MVVLAEMQKEIEDIDMDVEMSSEAQVPEVKAKGKSKVTCMRAFDVINSRRI